MRYDARMRLMLLGAASLLLILGCAGAANKDVDQDGYKAKDDCDDTRADVNPGATELCDPADVDEDCDGVADNADTDADGTIVVYRDADLDGYGDPAAESALCEAIEGYATSAGDCDDADSRANPDAVEVCDPDGVDEDCNGLVNDEDPDVLEEGMVESFRDADGDGRGDTEISVWSCEPGDGWVLDSDDCDDGSAAASPDNDELCNGFDDDCDGEIDEDSAADAPTWHGDTDGDGFGNPIVYEIQCEPPAGYVDDGTDCDDADEDAHPGATERCGGGDEDCDGDVDESGAEGETTWYLDSDSDAYGDASAWTLACDAPSGYVADDTDCDDASSGVSPADTEACDAADTDEDCDGLADDDDPSVAASGKTTYYRDADLDSYGTSSTTRSACDLPSGYATSATDCDDTSASIHPGGSEVCDNADADEDCDGAADDDDASVAAAGKSTFYLDSDGDGYGTSSGSVSACDAPAGYARYGTDCDDTTASISPGTTDIVGDGRDQDCDSVDSCYRDLDGDNYGSTVVVDGSSLDCATGSGALVSTDCNDADATISPAGTETVADGIDQDCDLVDACYQDADGDGYGTTTVVDGSSLSCGTITGSPVSTDCDDGDRGVNPGNTEICDDANVDEDCDGVADDADPSVAPTTFVTYYLDADGDDYGDASVTVAQCDAPSGHVADGDDCDDTDAAVSPAATEVCFDAVDDDCDGITQCIAQPADADRILTGAASGNRAGYVANAGDQDGDGIDDLLVGAPYAATAYMVYGGGASMSLSSADAKRTGFSGDTSTATALDGIGDVNGDGVDDIAIGAPLQNYSYTDDGVAVVFLGPMTGTSTFYRANETIRGDVSDHFASDIVGVGDVSGDGRDDFLMSAPNDGGGAGSVYLFTSYTSGGVTSTAGSTASLYGSAPYDDVGGSIAAAGDVNADGYADFIVGADLDSGAVTDSGAAYLVLGPQSGTTGIYNADAKLKGEAYLDYAGYRVGGGGDFDGDGYDDVAVVASAVGSYGAVYVELGPMSGSVYLSAADLKVEETQETGLCSVALDGDFDGDGNADLAYGNSSFDTAASNAGRVAVFLGPATGTTTSDSADIFIEGTSSTDEVGWSLTYVGAQDGGAASDLFVGGRQYGGTGGAFLFGYDSSF